jgi:uncharacterized membrane protein
MSDQPPAPDLAEQAATAVGSWRFIGWMTLVIAVWIAWNTALPDSWRFDRYPFILLTLALSLQASYAAPLILLAQNQQGDRDRARAEQDLTTDTEALGLLRQLIQHFGLGA